MKVENKSMTGKKEHKKKTFAEWTAEQLKQVVKPAKKGGKG